MFTAKMTLPTELIAQMKAAAGPDALQATDGPLAAAGTYLVRDGIPAKFMSAGDGTWPPVKRGGTPLMLKGGLLAGFTWAIDGNRVRVTTTGKPANIVAVLNDGATIRPKVESHTVTRGKKTFTVKNYLRFKIGDQWVRRLSVVIPPRPWNVWTEVLRAGSIDAATKAIVRMLGL